MCGRFRLTRASKRAERFGIEPDDDWFPRYNIAPTQPVEVIRQQPERPKRFGSHMRWGLIPYWAKDASISYKMINAHAETVATKPALSLTPSLYPKAVNFPHSSVLSSASPARR